jgi:hypothetical protein
MFYRCAIRAKANEGWITNTMRSSKSRSRSKSNRNNNNNRSGGNVVNRVFDSSGPESKVRGTPQQIIDKYNQLARDAQLSNDRVAAENFQQHAEHYMRLLSDAQKEMDARREQQEKENRERQAERDRERAQRQERDAVEQAEQAAQQPDPSEQAQPDIIAAPASDDGGLVETPEDAPKAKKPRRSSRSRPRKSDEDSAEATAPSADADQTAAE